MKNTIKLEKESQLEYIFRLVKGKDDGIYDLSYPELLKLCFDITISQDEARKRYYALRSLLPYLDGRFSASKSHYAKQLKYDETKERIKLRDERNLLNDYLRKIARLEHYETLIRENAEMISASKPLIPESIISHGETDCAGILQLSDWHYALEIDNAWNKYNTDIFKTRIAYIKDRTIEIIKNYKIPAVYVLSQGDLVSSSIRSAIRLQNQEDIIKQIMNTSEALAEIIYHLSRYTLVKVIMVGGNHDRVTAHKDDSLPKENYVRLAKWHLETRLRNNPNIKILNNELGLNIGTFKEFDMTIGVVHGHDDNFNSIVKNLSSFARTTFDIIFTSHRHHASYSDLQKCRVIANSALCGIDDYSEHLRLTSYAGQNFTLINRNKEVFLFPIITP